MRQKMKSRKNSDSIANQKRLFMRMKSPTAFGSARRFDSASFMNVPPEMARRDAAYHCFSAFFRASDFSGKKRAERCLIYERILKLLAVIEEKSEFILNADTIEKRNLENADSLAFVRLLQKYFIILNNLAALQMDTAAQAQTEKPASLVTGDFFERLDPIMQQNEEVLTAAVKALLEENRDLLLSQQAQRCKLFSKSDSERYERAYALYADYYSNLENV